MFRIPQTFYPVLQRALGSAAKRTPAVASSTQTTGQAPSTASFHTSAPRHDFGKDILFGAAGGDTQARGLREQQATDNYLFTSPLSPAQSAAKAAYAKAFEQYAGRPLNDTELFNRPWEQLGFANRNQVDSDDGEAAIEGLPQINGSVRYARAAMQTALKRGGEIWFTLNGWNPSVYFVEALAAEIEHACGFAAYLEAPGTPCPKITNLELGDMLEGGSQKTPVTFLSTSGRPLNDKAFREQFAQTMARTRSPACRARLTEALQATRPRDDSIEEFIRSQAERQMVLQNFRFDAPAEQAIADMRQMIA